MLGKYAISTGQLALAVIVTLTAAGCGRADHTPSPTIRRLIDQARPIGPGPHFQPRAAGSPVGRCQRQFGPRIAAHIEVFARNRAVIIPSGIGVRDARTHDGRVLAARCYGRLVTLDPTGVVLTTLSPPSTLAELFSAWGVPLSRSQLAGFHAAHDEPVRVYINGHRHTGSPGRIVITHHAEIVLELGPYVRPHINYTFPARLFSR